MTLRERINEQIINEKSLSRIEQMLVIHEAVFITTYRGSKTAQENIKSNIKLKADLIKRGYGVTNIKGTYQETGNDKPSKEKSFVVVNLKNDSNFFDVMKEYGAEYQQDSILYSNPKDNKTVLVDLTGGKDKIFEKIKTHVEDTPDEMGNIKHKAVTIIGNKKFVFESGHMHIWDNKNIYSKGCLDQILLQEEEDDFNVVKYSVNESSLNRIIQALDKYESVFITTYRSGKTAKQNIDSNVKLKTKLLKMGYGVTKVKGTYQENVSDDVSKEKSFVVTNLKNESNFLETMKKFGKEHNQDSILYSDPKNNKTVLVDLTETGEDEVFDKIRTRIQDVPDENGEIKDKAITIIGNRKFVFENTHMREYGNMSIYSKAFLEKRLINEEL